MELDYYTWYKIALEVDIKSVQSICGTNFMLSRICKDESFWREKLIRDFSLRRPLGRSFRETYRYLIAPFQDIAHLDNKELWALRLKLDYNINLTFKDENPKDIYLRLYEKYGKSLTVNAYYYNMLYQFPGDQDLTEFPGLLVIKNNLYHFYISGRGVYPNQGEGIDLKPNVPFQTFLHLDENGVKNTIEDPRNLEYPLFLKLPEQYITYITEGTNQDEIEELANKIYDNDPSVRDFIIPRE